MEDLPFSLVDLHASMQQQHSPQEVVDQHPGVDSCQLWLARTYKSSPTEAGKMEVQRA